MLKEKLITHEEIVASFRGDAGHDNAVALSEDHLADVLAKENANTLRWVQAWGRWLRWDGTRWREDETIEVFDRARTVCRRFAADAPNDGTRATLSRASTVAAVEKMAKSDRRLAAITDQWDRDQWILNTPDGTIDLRTGEVNAHDPDEYLTKITTTGPGTGGDRWRQFLHEVTAGDTDLQGFLQRMTGYALTGCTREHALFFLYGTGGNGEGVFLNSLTKALGDYATVAGMDVFVEKRGEAHPTELAMLRGARLVIAQETEEGRRWAESRIKALTGGDPITARFMRQDFFTFQPAFKLVIAGNHRPVIGNVDEAMRRRLHLVPFTVTIPDSSKDKDLEEKLLTEAGAILQWAIDGCLQYQEIGLEPPECVRAATDEYLTTQDNLALWIQDCCERGPGFWEQTSMLFSNWTRWAESVRVDPGNHNSFADRMIRAGFTKNRDRSRGRHWLGVRLKQIESRHWSDPSERFP